MRILLYILILALNLIAPVDKLDVAKLEPVQIVCLCESASGVGIITDTQAWGLGSSVEAAFRDLEERTPGVVYLDTARYLLVTEGLVSVIDQIRPHVSGEVKMCLTDTTELKEMEKYLNVHGQLPKLKHWKQGDWLPVYSDGKIVE